MELLYVFGAYALFILIAAAPAILLVLTASSAVAGAVLVGSAVVRRKPGFAAAALLAFGLSAGAAHVKAQYFKDRPILPPRAPKLQPPKPGK